MKGFEDTSRIISLDFKPRKHKKQETSDFNQNKKGKNQRRRKRRKFSIF
jgi:hypothetical protein